MARGPARPLLGDRAAQSLRRCALAPTAARAARAARPDYVERRSRAGGTRVSAQRQRGRGRSTEHGIGRTWPPPRLVGSAPCRAPGGVFPAKRGRVLLLGGAQVLD